MNISENQLAHYLIDTGLIDMTAAGLLDAARKDRLALVNWLYQQTLLKPAEIVTALADCFNLECIDLTEIALTRLPLHQIDETLIRQHQVLPIACEHEQLTLAVADPTKIQVFDTIQFHSGLTLKIVIAKLSKLQQIITQTLSHSHYHNAQTLPAPGLKADETKVISLIDQVFLDALSRNASDIHFEYTADYYRIRMRIDGLLHTITHPVNSLAPRIITRLKVLAHLDISERRLPQDGRFTLELPNQQPLDCRISTCPTLLGEKVVARLLKSHQSTLRIDTLGMSQPQRQRFLQTINQPQGMILVTGPTGSGKTITLYSALAQLNASEKNITTIEEPVEIQVTGINQINVNPKINLTFAKTLRAILRQDPDVIMIGEIRDLETAEIAIKAAQTGHLVLATLHTNSTFATINRLINLGLAPYNITEVVKLIVAQRLVRKLCVHCKKPAMKPSHGLQAHGCQHCTEGYYGRLGIFELLPMVKTVQNTVLNRQRLIDEDQLLGQLGCATLHQSGLACVSQGLTTFAELQRVLPYKPSESA